MQDDSDTQTVEALMPATYARLPDGMKVDFQMPTIDDLECG